MKKTGRNRELSMTLYANGISCRPLHDEVLLIAEQIGEVHMDMGRSHCKAPLALDYIRKTAKKGQLGFKRQKVREV